MMKKLTSLLLSAALMISLLACGASAAKTESGVRIAGLKGPTTMGLVNLLDMERSGKASQHYDLQLYGAADEIVPKLIKGELDMAAIPANLAATLYQKTNGGIQVMAVNTLGVLYVVEKGDSIHSFADLKGRTILSTGKGTTPEYVLRYLLTKNGLDPDKDVKIEYYSEASEVTAQMAASKKDAIAVLPQPYVTAAQLKDSSLRVVLDLTKEWNKVCDTQLITGVTVVRTEYAKENPDIVANFLRDYEKSIKAAQTDVAGTAALCEETGVVAKKAIAQKALPQCNIVYRVGDEMKADVNAYLKVLYDASPAAVGGKLPDANFYYTKATPVASFIILALVWVSGRSLSILISFLMVLPVLYSAVRTGIESADVQLLEMAQVFHLPLARRVKAIWLPAILPAFRQGCSVALGICWKSGVAAEVIGLPDGSIGDALYRAKITLSTGELFAWTFVIILLSAGFEKLFLALLDKAVARVLGEDVAEND